MNERLLEYLPDPNTVKGGLAEVVEVMQREAPLVVGEIVRWHMAHDFLWATIWCLVTLAVVHILRKRLYPPVKRAWTASDDDASLNDEFVACGGAVLGIVIAVFALISGYVTISYLCDAMKCIIAPRLFLLEYFTELAK